MNVSWVSVCYLVVQVVALNYRCFAQFNHWHDTVFLFWKYNERERK